MQNSQEILEIEKGIQLEKNKIKNVTKSLNDKIKELKELPFYQQIENNINNSKAISINVLKNNKNNLSSITKEHEIIINGYNSYISGHR